jgi:YidC/Oxa1 family membrane protein insertase
MTFINELWSLIIQTPLFNLLIFFYRLCGNNLGIAIVGITLFIKLLTYPLQKPSMEFSKKQIELKPELDKLKETYKDKQVLAQKQMELYKEHGMNPALGCLPQLISIIFVFIPLYNIFSNFLNHKFDNNTMNLMLYNWDYLKFQADEVINTMFLGIDFAQKNYILAGLSAASQFVLSKMMMPQTKKMEKLAKDTPDKDDDIMYNMQEQMIYTMPILTFVIGIGLPSGLSWYWLVSTIITALQYKISNRK